MNVRTRLVRAGVSAGAMGLCAFDARPAPTYNPNRHMNNDPIWEQLNQAEVVADRARG